MADYVDREALITRLEKVCATDDVFGMGVKTGVEHAINCLKEAPAADVVEVRHGRWVETITHNGETFDYDLVCSVCGESGVPFQKHCSGCGAKMDGKEVEGE